MFGAIIGLGQPLSRSSYPYLLTHKSNTPHLSEVVTNDHQIVTECVDCDHFPREGLAQVGAMLSLLRKRFIGS
jgi:hypothetical protein